MIKVNVKNEYLRRFLRAHFSESELEKKVVENMGLAHLAQITFDLGKGVGEIKIPKCFFEIEYVEEPKPWVAWLPYPENKPQEKGYYLVSRNGCRVNVFYKDQREWSEWGVNAFIKLPEPYKPTEKEKPSA